MTLDSPDRLICKISFVFIYNCCSFLFGNFFEATKTWSRTHDDDFLGLLTVGCVVRKLRQN